MQNQRKIINENCINSRSSCTVKNWMGFQWIYKFSLHIGSDLKLENNVGKFETFTRKKSEILLQNFVLLELLIFKCYEDDKNKTTVL